MIHNIEQGSDAWLQFRLEHFGASEAAAMLGLSKTVKRTELLHAKHTGNPREFSDWVQANILDYGHEVEAKARPLVEELIGAELYPVTCSNGPLSASCDGLTMDESIAFEHKQWASGIAQQVSAGEMPAEHMPQCQQVLLVTGADKVIFVVSDGTPEKMAHIHVLPDQEWFARLQAGWDQFAKDLAAYTPAVIADKPSAVAIRALPALTIQLRGEVMTSNLPAFKAAAEQFIDNIKTDLRTDNDFADAEATVKFCDKAEKDLEFAKAAAIAQTASIDELMRVVDHIRDQLRGKRLELDKLVTKRKAEIKDGIILKARKDYEAHVAGLKAETAGLWLALPLPDFAGAAKSKRTLASLQDAVDSVLANGKIEADASAKRIRACLTCLRDDGAGYEFLFADRAALVGKPLDDLRLLIKSRIDAHQAAQAAAADRALAEAGARPAPVPATVVPAAPSPAALAAPVTITAPAASGAIRAELDRHLDRLSEADLQVVLRFVASRFGAERYAA